ncbi:MAG: hypothetical protein MUO31_07720 [Thermodesulfovibrionales bacterium]|nr:hypothetical protein [Thermodesulfovibrionales bacterium]
MNAVLLLPNNHSVAVYVVYKDLSFSKSGGTTASSCQVFSKNPKFRIPTSCGVTVDRTYSNTKIKSISHLSTVLSRAAVSNPIFIGGVSQRTTLSTLPPGAAVIRFFEEYDADRAVTPIEGKLLAKCLGLESPIARVTITLKKNAHTAPSAAQVLILDDLFAGETLTARERKLIYGNAGI